MKKIRVRGHRESSYFMTVEVQEKLLHVTKDVAPLVYWTYEIIRTNQGTFIGVTGNAGGGWLYTKITEDEAQQMVDAADWEKFDKIYNEIVERVRWGE